jgi:hypothetical protein
LVIILLTASAFVAQRVETARKARRHGNRTREILHQL